jgi:hypothetical protein
MESDGALGQPPPTWDLWRDAMDKSNHSEAGRQAGHWALEQLEYVLGPDWPVRVWRKEGAVPPEIAMAHAHLVAFGQLLEFALRVTILAGLNGFGAVRQDLRSDLRLQRRIHARLQLEVAALTLRAGHPVALEARTRGAGRPVDVLIGESTTAIGVEARVILRDEVSQQGVSFWDRVDSGLWRIRARYDVEFAGELHEQLTDNQLDEWLTALESAAALVLVDGKSRVLELQTGTITVIKGPLAAGTTFKGPVNSANGWPRLGIILRAKADQAVNAGASWLRVDVMDGLWQFSPWARWTLAAKTEALSEAVRQELHNRSGLAGAILTCGALLAQGQFEDETCPGADGATGLRRLIAPARVRESVVVPLIPEARSEGELWARLYSDEPTWLDWALAKCDLRLAAEVLAWQPMPSRS